MSAGGRSPCLLGRRLSPGKSLSRGVRLLRGAALSLCRCFTKQPRVVCPGSLCPSAIDLLRVCSTDLTWPKPAHWLARTLGYSRARNELKVGIWWSGLILVVNRSRALLLWGSSMLACWTCHKKQQQMARWSFVGCCCGVNMHVMHLFLAAVAFSGLPPSCCCVLIAGVHLTARTTHPKHWRGLCVYKSVQSDQMPNDSLQCNPQLTGSKSEVQVVVQPGVFDQTRQVQYPANCS